jgi:hypothetical protein
MQQQRRIYAGEGRNPGVAPYSAPEVLSDDSNIVNFLLRNLPKQTQLMASLRDNCERIEVDIDLMEWVDVDYVSEHQLAAAISSSIILNFPHFYKNLSLACDHLRSALCIDQAIRAIHRSQIRCNIKLPCVEEFFCSNSNTAERKIRILRGRIAAIHNEKQIVKSRAFSCSNDNCRLFMKEVTHNVWFFDDLESTPSSTCSSCGISCMVEDISACQVAEHQIWMLVPDRQTCESSMMYHQVSVYEQIIENPHLYLGCQVEMVVRCNLVALCAVLQ